MIKAISIVWRIRRRRFSAREKNPTAAAIAAKAAALSSESEEDG
jgi:hypothetical protein